MKKAVGVVPVPAARWQCAVARKEKHQSVLYLLKTFKLQLEKNLTKMQKKTKLPAPFPPLPTFR